MTKQIYKTAIGLLILCLVISHSISPANAFGFCDSPKPNSFSGRSNSIKSYAKNLASGLLGTTKSNAASVQEPKNSAHLRAREAKRQARINKQQQVTLENNRRLKAERTKKFLTGLGTALAIAGAVAEGINRSRSSSAVRARSTPPRQSEGEDWCGTGKPAPAGATIVC